MLRQATPSTKYFHRMISSPKRPGYGLSHNNFFSGSNLSRRGSGQFLQLCLYQVIPSARAAEARQRMICRQHIRYKRLTLHNRAGLLPSRTCNIKVEIQFSAKLNLPTHINKECPIGLLSTGKHQTTSQHVTSSISNGRCVQRP